MLLRGLLAGAPEAALAGPGPELVTEAAPGGLRPELVILLLRGLLAGAPEAAPASLGPELVVF